MRFKHTYRTMMMWEDITNKPFELKTVSDIVRYAFVCYSLYGGTMTLQDFADDFTDEDRESLQRQMSAGVKKKARRRWWQWWRR